MVFHFSAGGGDGGGGWSIYNKVLTKAHINHGEATNTHAADTRNGFWRFQYGTHF